MLILLNYMKIICQIFYFESSCPKISKQPCYLSLVQFYWQDTANFYVVVIIFDQVVLCVYSQWAQQLIHQLSKLVKVLINLLVWPIWAQEAKQIKYWEFYIGHSIFNWKKKFKPFAVLLSVQKVFPLGSRQCNAVWLHHLQSSINLMQKFLFLLWPTHGVCVHEKTIPQGRLVSPSHHHLAMSCDFLV